MKTANCNGAKTPWTTVHTDRSRRSRCSAEYSDLDRPRLGGLSLIRARSFVILVGAGPAAKTNASRAKLYGDRL
jgi:hypothetical protein